MTFDIDDFVEQCRAALAEIDAQGAMRDAMSAAVRHGDRLADAVPPSARELGGLVHYSPELTVLWIEWPPAMYDPPHNHGAWAAVGVYTGEEASVLYRRRSDATIEPAAKKSLTAGEVAVLGAETIHAVTNPLRTWTGALHVYAGDFLSSARREWDERTLEERQWDAGASLERYTAAVRAADDQPR